MSDKNENSNLTALDVIGGVLGWTAAGARAMAAMLTQVHEATVGIHHPDPEDRGPEHFNLVFDPKLSK